MPVPLNVSMQAGRYSSVETRTNRAGQFCTYTWYQSSLLYGSVV
jgi:hypothetical protein